MASRASEHLTAGNSDVVGYDGNIRINFYSHSYRFDHRLDTSKGQERRLAIEFLPPKLNKFWTDAAGTTKGDNDLGVSDHDVVDGTDVIASMQNQTFQDIARFIEPHRPAPSDTDERSLPLDLPIPTTYRLENGPMHGPWSLYNSRHAAFGLAERPADVALLEATQKPALSLAELHLLTCSICGPTKYKTPDNLWCHLQREHGGNIPWFFCSDRTCEKLYKGSDREVHLKTVHRNWFDITKDSELEKTEEQKKATNYACPLRLMMFNRLYICSKHIEDMEERLDLAVIELDETSPDQQTALVHTASTKAAVDKGAEGRSGPRLAISHLKALEIHTCRTKISYRRRIRPTLSTRVALRRTVLILVLKVSRKPSFNI
jgi:hypothetical protein